MPTQPGLNPRPNVTSATAASDPSRLADGAHRDDTSLIESCKLGNRAAWDTLLARYEKSIYSFAYRLSRNHDDAADITSQVFLRLCQHLHSFRSGAPFDAWLFRVVRHVYIDSCVRAAYRTYERLDVGQEAGVGSLILEIPDSAPSPEQVCLDAEREGMLRDAVRSLPGYQRVVVHLYHTEGCSYQEIVDRTGLSLGTVKSRLWRARQTLRERLLPMQDILTADHFQTYASRLDPSTRGIHHDVELRPRRSGRSARPGPNGADRPEVTAS